MEERDREREPVVAARGSQGGGLGIQFIHLSSPFLHFRETISPSQISSPRRFLNSPRRTKFTDSCISCIKIYEQDIHLSSHFLHFRETISPSRILPRSIVFLGFRRAGGNGRERQRESWLWQREAAGAVASVGADGAIQRHRLRRERER